MVSWNYLRLALLIAVGIAATATDASAVISPAGSIRIAPHDTSLNLDATNYSAEAILAARTLPDYQVANAIVLKFDLSNVPAGAIVEKATLQLALVQSDAALDDTYTVSAHKLLGRKIDVGKASGFTADGVTPWTPNTCCANAVPMAQADISPSYDAKAIDKAPGFKTWDITTMVDEWLVDPATDSALLLNADVSGPGDRYRIFASMEHPDARLRPYLTIQFAAVDPTSASDGVHVLTALASDTAGNLAISAETSVSVDNGIIVLSPADTSLRLDANSYSAAPALTTYTWPDYKVSNAIVLKFDLAAIPAGALIEEATLHLALVQSDTSLDLTYTVSAHKIVGKNPVVSKATGYTADGVAPWTASACCYNGVPLAQADISAPYDHKVIDKLPGDKTWAVTSMVQEWLADPASNFGLLLNADASKPHDRYRLFASMEHETTILRPYLRVKYSLQSASDTIPPSVTMTAPPPNTYVSGTVRLSAAASDNVAVAGVQFKLDGAPLGPELTAAPYIFDWDTTALADGDYTLTAVARDSAGNAGTSPGIKVAKDKRPPAISDVRVSSITGSSASISWTTDESSDSQVEYGLTTAYGSSTALDTNLVTSHSVALNGLADGKLYHFRVHSRDAAGNLVTSPDATFNTPAATPPPPDATPPVVSVTAPTDGTTVSCTVTVEASASDDVGVVGVQFQIDGANLGAEDTLAPFSLSWDSTLSANGLHTLTAVARDAAGNKTASAAVTVNVSNVEPPPPTILWSADHEEGNLSDWYSSGGGGEFNTGGVSLASRDVAHRGAWSAKGTIPSGVSAVRLFRWKESRANPQAYYSAWYYFPQKINSSVWGNNIFQFKSKRDSERSDPFWDLNVRLRPNGNMYLILNWWCGLTVEGPHVGESGCRAYQQTLKDLPVGRWVHIEAFLKQSAGFDGQIIVWQDGTEIFNQNNVKTRYPSNGGWGPNDWSINNYGENVLPSPFTAYFDDAVVSLTRLGPGTSDSTPPPTATSCQTSGASWQNQAFAPQSGTFTAQFDAIPGANNIDAVIGLAAGNAAAYTDLAAIVRFNSAGNIDARNAGGYSALASIPYVAGTTYRVRIAVDVPARSYSVYVTPAGGSEQAIGINYAFRSEQAAASTLSVLASFTNGGTLQICNFAVTQ